MNVRAQRISPPPKTTLLEGAAITPDEAHCATDEGTSFHELASLYAGETFLDGFLNKLELKSIAALIAYIAATEGASVKAVQSFVETAFGVEDLRQIEQGNYNSVMHFLVDMKLKETLN